MESTLHRQLKERYGPARGGRSEVVVAGYRIDAVEPDGTLVEVQSGPLGPLRGKLARLLDLGHAVRVVKPVIIARRIVRLSRSGGRVTSTRMSPKRGALVEVFDDLVGVARLLGRPGLTIDVLAASIDERRRPRRRRPGYAVVDRTLLDIMELSSIRRSSDLWGLLPVGCEAGAFTTRDLAARLGRPLPFAQRVAYCLRHAGAALEVGKRGNARVYLRRDAVAELRAGASLAGLTEGSFGGVFQAGHILPLPDTCGPVPFPLSEWVPPRGQAGGRSG
jgi:hypothetical protein